MTYFISNHKQDCTGCGACESICAHKAIEMREDDEGFLYPYIDSSKCIDCGLCRLSCPVPINLKNQSFKDQTAYVAYTPYKEYSQKSATIGLCSMIAQKILSQGGVVFGCFLDESNWIPKHVRIETVNGIELIRNSKYAQSRTNDCFRDAKTLLKAKRKVLYIGTPCQIAGLKSFLKKDYENLITIDLICHGVFSYKLLQKEIVYWSNLLQGDIKNYKFRSKRKYPYSLGGVVNFDLYRDNKFIKHIERYAAFSPVYRLFAYSPDRIWYNLRPSCYTCHFRSKERIGDITIGDPHGISPENLGEFVGRKFRKEGISLFYVNTTKGESILRVIEDKLHKKTIPFNSSFTQQALLHEALDIPDRREQIYNSHSSNLGEIVQDMFALNLEAENRKFEYEWKKKEIIINLKDLVKTIILYKYWRK